MTTFLRPNPSSGVPIYLQLTEQVKDALETGALRPGDSLPGVHGLAEELVVNPNAVARAYRELEAEGVIAPRTDAATRLAFRQDSPKRSPTTDTTRSSRALVLENSRLSARIAAETAFRTE